MDILYRKYYTEEVKKLGVNVFGRDSRKRHSRPRRIHCRRISPPPPNLSPGTGVGEETKTCCRSDAMP